MTNTDQGGYKLSHASSKTCERGLFNTVLWLQSVTVRHSGIPKNYSMFSKNYRGLMLHIHEIIWQKTALNKASSCGINQPGIFVLNKTNKMVHRRSVCNFKTLFDSGSSLIYEMSLILEQFKLTSLHTIFA